VRPSETFGSLKRAFKVILQATDAGEWDAIADKRRNDLLVYLALSHFGKRPKFKDLSLTSAPTSKPSSAATSKPAPLPT
jgi:hypothetical protein